MGWSVSMGLGVGVWCGVGVKYRMGWMCVVRFV